MKHSNFYPKQEICPWTPVLTYHPSRSGSVLGACSWATTLLHCQFADYNLEHVGTLPSGQAFQA